MRIKLSKTAIVIGSTVAGIALIGGGTAAYAAMTVAAKPSSVYGCVKKGVVDTSLSTGTRKCAAGQTLVEIGAQGPKGATGAKGATGPSTAGLAGLNVVVVTGKSVTGGAIAWCPASHPYVISGGPTGVTGTYGNISSEPVEAGPAPYEGAPGTVTPETGVSGWAVNYYSQHLSNGVYAICAK